MPLGPIAAADAGAIALRWGIRIDAMRLVSDGFILEFRYTVLDPSKAAPLSLRKLKPVLKDETSGAEVIVPEPPTTGALRSTFLPKAGRSYFMVFANPRRFVKPGNQVTITIGEFSVTGITVTTDTISKKPGIP